MSYDWQHYLRFADQLLQDGLDQTAEVTLSRVAIGRAYYAAFHAARLFVEARYFVTFGRKAVHYELKNWFRDDPDPAYQRIGRELGRLHLLRSSADYDGNFEPTLDDARKAARDARRMIAQLNEL